jgi:hypothetical protein
MKVHTAKPKPGVEFSEQIVVGENVFYIDRVKSDKFVVYNRARQEIAAVSAYGVALNEIRKRV